MGNQKKNDSFIMQAGILAAAGIISRIIGILYRSPLTMIIGNEGNGYFGSAYYIYTIILLISSYSIPSAISKVIAQRLALKEYRNAHRIFHCALIYVIVVGGIASIFTYFGAGILVENNSVPVLRIFAPTIFFSGLLGVLRGYFQAHKTMLQTSFSQIIEQIINAVVSILAAYLLIQTVSNENETTQAIYGAVGSAMGTGAGVIIALIFMFSIYMMNKNTIHGRIKRDRTRKVLPYSKIFMILFSVVTPFILSTAIYNSSTPLNQTIFTKIMINFKNISEKDTSILYGIFSGQTMTIINIPIAIASAMSAAMIPIISQTYVTGDIKGTNKKVGEAIHMTMLISIPSVVGIYVLAEPVIQFLFNIEDSIELSTKLLQALCVAVVFYGLSTLTNAVLQGVGKVNIPVINASIALLIQTAVFAVLMVFTDLQLYAFVIATIIYSLSMCILNTISVKKYLGYKQDYIKTFLLPIIASLIMGIVTYGTYKGVYLLVKSNIISLFTSIIIAVLVYFMTGIKIGAIDRQDLMKFPKGRTIIRFAEKAHLLSR